MPQFNYMATDSRGQKVKGVVTANTEAEVRVYLRSQNLRPIKIFKTDILNLDLGVLLGLSSGTSNADLILFSRQLSILISSGVPLMQSLDIISEQLKSRPGMQKVVLFVKEKVTNGSFLWESMSFNKKTFSPLYVNMIRAGETSGALDVILKRLVKYVEDIEKLKKMIKSAMIYPSMIMTVSFGVILLMLYFVIPKFEAMFKNANKNLPEITQFVIDSSHFVQTNILYILGGVGALVFLTTKYISTPEGKKFYDYNILKVPKLGDLILKVSIARFGRTMQTLLRSGVTLLDALEICRTAIGNAAIEDGIAKIKSDISQGKTLTSSMQKVKYLPHMAIQMISVGESTGHVDDMLEKVADWYEEEVQMAVANLSKAIEPIVLVLLGGIVAGLLIAMYLPIIQMAGTAGK